MYLQSVKKVFLSRSNSLRDNETHTKEKTYQQSVHDGDDVTGVEPDVLETDLRPFELLYDESDRDRVQLLTHVYVGDVADVHILPTSQLLSFTCKLVCIIRKFKHSMHTDSVHSNFQRFLLLVLPNSTRLRYVGKTDLLTCRNTQTMYIICCVNLLRGYQRRRLTLKIVLLIILRLSPIL